MKEATRPETPFEAEQGSNGGEGQNAWALQDLNL